MQYKISAPITYVYMPSTLTPLAYNDLIEETKDFTSGLLGTSLVVIHDAEGGGEHKVAEPTRRKNVLHPLLDVMHRDIETGGDHSALVDAANQVDNNLARAVVIKNLEFSDVAYKMR